MPSLPSYFCHSCSVSCHLPLPAMPDDRNSPPNNEKLAELSYHLAVKNLAAPPSGRERNLAVKTKIWRN